MRRAPRLAARPLPALAFLVALLAACVDGGNDSGIATAPTAGGTALPYTDGDGVPELTATPGYAPTSLAADGSVTVSVPVDDETRGVSIALSPAAGGTTTAAAAATPGAATEVELPLIPYMAAGLYAVHVTVCSAADCASGAGTARTVYAPAPEQGVYYRSDPDADTASATTVAVAPSSFAVTASSKGSPADPIVLALNSRQRGWVRGGGVTYYRIATQAGRLYSLRVEEAGQTRVLALDGGPECAQLTSRWICVRAADGAPVDFATGNALVTGGTYLLLAQAYDAPGTAAVPTAVVPGTPLAAAVDAGGSAHFMAPATAGNAYTVAMYKSLATDLALAVYDDDATFATPIDCGPTGSTAETETCTFTVAADTVYFTVSDADTGTGGIFTAYVDAERFNEGSAGGELTVTPGMAHAGSSAASGASYYRAAVPAGAHTVTLSDLSVPAVLTVQGVNFAQTPAADDPVCEASGNDFGGTLACDYTPTGATLYVRVASSPLGATYTLTVQ